jgi:methionyl-tRNA formyltransferase
MNIVFFGSDRFAVPALSQIISSSHKITCVVTQPDRLKGRGLALSCTEVKKIAQAYNISVYQPENINRQERVEFLRGLNPDMFVVVAFGQILSRPVLEIPRIMTINLHASLLPKYRGAAPVNWALIKGETQTGVSIIKMNERLDEGPIILQRSLEIEDSEDAQSLQDRLSVLGADLLLEALDSIQDNRYSLIIQQEKDATPAPKLKKGDGLIRWDKSARDINNLIRGCAGWPGAFSYYQGKILKIHRARRTSGNQDIGISELPGEILRVSKEEIIVATAEGNLDIEEMQLEGKRRMTAQEFISGHRISVGERLG